MAITHPDHTPQKNDKQVRDELNSLLQKRKERF